LGGRHSGRWRYVQAVASKTRNILIGVPTWRDSNWHRQHLHCNFNIISVRIFVLTGAPFSPLRVRTHHSDNWSCRPPNHVHPERTSGSFGPRTSDRLVGARQPRRVGKGQPSKREQTPGTALANWQTPALEIA